jgi:phasin family protein
VADQSLNTAETKVEKAVDTVKAPVEAVAQKAVEAIEAPAVKAKRAVKARRVRQAPAKVVKAVRKVNARAAKAAGATVEKQIEGTNFMTYDFTKLFGELPNADKFQTLFAGAGEKGQQLAEKGQKAAADMVVLAKANAEAVAESGRIAIAGVRDLGRDLIADSRETLDKASESFKSLSAATSPAEFFQLQSELTRGAFDQFVAESSMLTERLVKLAGDSAQPLQARASRNAEVANTLTA